MSQPHSTSDLIETFIPMDKSEVPFSSYEMENEEKIELTKEEVMQKHRLEKKNLHNQIQALKKSVPKGDKNKKKAVAEEIAKLERQCQDKHASELSVFENAAAIVVGGDGGTDEEMDMDVTDETLIEAFAPRVSRAQKRREKKDLEAKERERRILEQIEKNEEEPRYMEILAIGNLLKDMNLKIHNIPANGNCLYLAIIHQLQLNGLPNFSVTDLRKKTANYLRAHKEEFMPFMSTEDESSNINITDDSFEKYCKEVEQTKLWGSQLELRAMANLIGCPIRVIQSTGPPTIQGEDFDGPELIITFHRYLYQLGEHYNSTVPLPQERG